MKSIEFVEKVKALNLVAGVNEVQAVAKQNYPQCEIRQMGFNGGYSPVIEDKELFLRSYDGDEDKSDFGDGVFENLDNCEYAFGTININLGENNYQIYHIGLGEWFVEIQGSIYENEKLGSYQNAINYILKLGSK